MPPSSRHAHCSYCGHPYDSGLPWPRSCSSCANVSYLNPLPVAVALVPVDAGLLCIRRSIPPAIGKLALPGGFLEVGETWQEGCVRELREETGLHVESGEVQLFRVHSAAREGLILVFGLVRARTRAQLPAFTVNEETSEMVVLAGPEDLAFPLHTAVVRDYFEQRSSLSDPR